jgi:DnaJ-class molecular chaperone
MQTKQLVAFFKGTAGEYNKLGAGLACSLMGAAADMRNTVSPIRAATCAACDGTGKVAMPDGPDDYQWTPCEACGGSGRVVVDNLINV